MEPEPSIDDAEDAKLARGEEELIPAEFVNRIVDGENKVRVWREYRGLTVKALAEAAGLTPAALAAIEDGGIAPPAAIQKIAAALRLNADDLE